MFLEILIPTYNREKYLRKNLEELSSIINSLNLCNDVSIAVSDNCSNDNTERAVDEFINNRSIHIRYYKQSVNIGCAENLKYLVTQCKSEYFMLLGDDDYVSSEYIEAAINLLRQDATIGCILPSFAGIDEDGNPAPWAGRDLQCEQKYFTAGYDNLYNNSMRSHQLSGIIIKHSLVQESLAKVSISNLYPQVFMTSLACLLGSTVHLPQYPIKVTQTKKKDWSYDRTGLLTGIFENYCKLGLSQYQRFRIEKKWINKSSWRITHDWYNPIKQIINTFALSFSKNTSIPGHSLHPFIILYHWVKNGTKISFNLLFRR